jgi:hypothetical protein
MDVSLTRSAEGKTGRAFVGNMSEEKALELASKVVSEGFLYGVSLCDACSNHDQIVTSAHCMNLCAAIRVWPSALNSTTIQDNSRRYHANSAGGRSGSGGGAAEKEQGGRGEESEGEG